MARRLWLSALTLLVAFCLGLSLLAIAGAWILLQTNGAVPVGFEPLGSVFF